MRSIALFLLPLVLACTPANSPTALRASSVALIEFDEGQVHAYCSGTFVSHDEIITASHCAQHIIENTGADDDNNAVFTFIIADDQGYDISNMPAGQHQAKLQKIDRDVDLALLKVIQPNTFPHSFVSVAKERPAIGDKIYSVSTPHGLLFSYNEGVVSAYRQDVSNEAPYTGRYMQIALPGAYFGSSGAGVENSSGELIGVISLAPKVPSVMLAVDVQEIVSFLEEK